MRERLLIALIGILLLAMPVVAFVGEINAERGLQQSARPGLAGRYPQLNIPAQRDMFFPVQEATWVPGD